MPQQTLREGPNSKQDGIGNSPLMPASSYVPALEVRVHETRRPQALLPPTWLASVTWATQRCPLRKQDREPNPAKPEPCSGDPEVCSGRWRARATKR